jgi:hypothetical protein
MRSQRIVSSQLGCDLSGEARGKTAGYVELGELIQFRIGYRLEPHSFCSQLGHFPVALGAQFAVLDGAHGECSGHEPGESGEYQHARTDAGAGESLADSG